MLLIVFVQPAFPTFNFFGAPAAATGFAASTTTAANGAVDKPAPSTTDGGPKAADTTTHAAATPASAAASTATPTPMTSFAQLAAKVNADTWECPTCETRNNNSQSRCAACDTPKPASHSASTDSAAADKKETGAITSAGFSFPTLSFGSTVAAPKFGTGSGVVDFSNFFNSGGSSSSAAANGNAAANSMPTYSFAGMSSFALPNASTPLISFSTVAASSSTSSIASFTAPSISTIAAGSTASDSSVQFRDKKAESSGEETDEIVWKGQTKVFVMKKVTLGGESELRRDEDDEDGGGGGGERKEEKKEEAKEEGKAGEVVDKWIDVGTGELHINRYVTESSQRRARLIMRADKTHRLVLNVPLLASLASSFQLQADKYVRLASVNVEEGANKVVQYLLRVKGKAEAQQVLDTLKAVTDSVKAAEKPLS